MSPNISEHYKKREPSAIRKAQILFESRQDSSVINVINLAIGNISLPMHPAMASRLKNLGNPDSPFADGVVRYTTSEGTVECKTAIINSINAELSQTISKDANCVITDGGSQAMELMLLGVSGSKSNKSIMVIDPLYTNYVEFSKRLSIPMVSLERNISINGSFGDLDPDKIREKMDEENPNGILIIPADNPTGLQMSQNLINEIARICVEKDVWLISDEAYRNIYFSNSGPSSIWQIPNTDVPGIEGRRISIESVSKVWNACGLRIGALVTDNKIMYEKVRSEYTANLCANVIGQHVFGAVAHMPSSEIINWYSRQRDYYSNLVNKLIMGLKNELPGIILSSPGAAIYIVLDFKNITPSNFNTSKFIDYCSLNGKIKLNGKYHTLLLSTMKGFYNNESKGEKQARIAIVEPESKMKIVPKILSQLLDNYLKMEQSNCS
tara:strand:+ start:519 stop:1835 length:1317 start_codon:yes stop_codon:yes gene_type:complete